MSATTAVRSTPPRSDGRTPTPNVDNDLRRTLLALLATALGVFPLCQLFTDRGWLVDVWLTMAVVVLPAAVLRYRHQAGAGQIWIGVLLLVPWLTVNFVREHAVLGFLPFGGAWHDVGRLMTDLHNTTKDEVAPVHSTVAVRLALCALLGLVAALVDLLAVVGRRGALAGVPLLVVFTVSGAVPRHPVAWIWFAFSAAGFLILLALDSTDDLQRWGHYVPRSSRKAHRQTARAVSGQRIAAAAIALAVVLPIFIPADSRNFVSNLFHPDRGSGAGGFGADSTSGIGTGGIDPFAALRGQLNRNKNVDLLSVKVSSASNPIGSGGGVEPFYLRTNVLSTFLRDGWRPGPQGDTQAVGDTQFASSPGTSFEPSVVRYSADITVTGLRSNPPVFGSPTAITGVDGDTKWSLQDMLLIGSRIRGGQTIHEDVAQPRPSVADLRAATATDPQLAPWLRLPVISAYVHNLTDRVTARASTPYEKARAISDFFAAPSSQFTYSLQTASGDSGDDLTDFLTKRVGYCQQFAAAMGVMLRLSGVPARVVLGYAHDAPNINGTFKVTTYDAHAWVEAYFAGVGWVPFDPTPLAGISGGKTNDLAWAPHGKVTSGGVVTTPGSPTTRPTASPSRTSTNSATHGTGDRGSSLNVAITVVVLLVVIGVLLLVPATVRLRRRRHRLRQARHGDTDALWDELSDTAIDLGYVWSNARTPRQVAGWLGGSKDQASGSLRTLAAAVERARYAPYAAADTPDLVHEFAVVQAGLRSRRSAREQVRARFWPASLDWSRVRWIGQWLPGRPGAQRR